MELALLYEVDGNAMIRNRYIIYGKFLPTMNFVGHHNILFVLNITLLGLTILSKLTSVNDNLNPKILV